MAHDTSSFPQLIAMLMVYARAHAHHYAFFVLTRAGQIRVLITH